MREEDFRRFLLEDPNIESKIKAVNSRLSKARSVEDHFNINLDSYVMDDAKMHNLLLRIKDELHDSNGAKQNAVRKYYQFATGREFPRLSQIK
ncbi:MAG: hypothetical protein WBL93_01480 [Lutisporaceae bacterium]